MSGPDSLNNTYDQVVFTSRAVRHIKAHAAAVAAAAAARMASTPGGQGSTEADAEATSQDSTLFLYLAYHNVHDACQQDRFTSGLNAPLETVELYPTTILDTWKVQAAMTTELDYGVANVTEALKASGLWPNTVLVMVSDNGGPLDHSTNWCARMRSDNDCRR